MGLRRPTLAELLARPVPPPARVATIDGDQHDTAGLCGCDDECGACDQREHFQAVHDGIVRACEGCESDAHWWSPHPRGQVTIPCMGTYPRAAASGEIAAREVPDPAVPRGPRVEVRSQCADHGCAR